MATHRTVIVDDEAYQVSTDAFTVGEWAAAQYTGGLYVQGIITRIAAGVVTIKEEGIGRRGRRPHITVAIERVYERHPAGYCSKAVSSLT